MYFFFLISSFNIGYFVYKWGIINSTYKIYNISWNLYNYLNKKKLLENKNNLEIKKEKILINEVKLNELYILINKQNKTISELKFKINKLII